MSSTPSGSSPPRDGFFGRTFRVERPFITGLYVTLGVGIGLVVWGVVGRLTLLLTYIVIALFLSLALEPLIKLMMRTKMPRPLAVTLIMVVLSALVAGLIWAIVPVLVTQTTGLINIINETLQKGANQEWFKFLQNRFPDFDLDSLLKQVTSWFQRNVGAVGGGVLKVAFNIVSGILGAVIVLILTIYFSATMHIIKATAYKFVPADRRKRVEHITEQILTTVSRFTAGQASLALINGVLTLILFLILHFEYPILMALIAFLGSLIPLAGTLSGSILIALITWLSSPNSIWVVIIYYVVYMQVEAYLINPRIMNRAVSIPGSLVVISAIAGGTLLGILGAILAVPVAASILIIIKQVFLPRQEKSAQNGELSESKSNP